MNYNFSTNPIINITRSRFKMPFQMKTTFNAGELVPIDVTEVLPGDTYKRKTHAVIRMTTPIKPVMDNAWADIYHFFVPNRIVWEHWEEFQGANKSGPWTQKTEYTIPQITAPTNGWTKGTIADHMGIPTKVGNISINHLPFRAYVKIWNEWFRDENLQNFSYLNTSDATTTGTNENNYVTSPITGGMCLPVSKPHDYFTSALPEPQKGPDVLLPLGQTAPVVGNGKAIGFSGINGNAGTRYMVFGGVDNYQQVSMGYESSKPSSPPTAGTTAPGRGISTTHNYVGLSQHGPWSGMVTDLSEATAATINQIRQAFQLQKMFEKDARGGTRYVEILKNHFGVTASDQRLQRPEYLGGERVPITMTQVLQTSSTDSESPQGNTAAYSLTINSHNSFTKSFEEHGYIISLVCVRTHHTYQQGINKMWNRKKRTDFYMPVFANIGEQPILNQEIFAQGTDTDKDAFGFQEAWAEYRTKPDVITGEFRSNYENTLDFWHYGDYYTSLPTLGADFIKETKVNIDRTLAVQSSVQDQFIADFYFEDIATRPMPVYSIPGLVDHH
ncbi:major capsid protein [Sigmofec virus UA08Rod_6125]|uniref:Major capsid protein n=1 Tax=Sigmofec virus UA08Rod_6125 TaxID=2929454 RepID=A0A976N0Y5_9VIRU|nr:major capsid protein [Sigmofec virus UA08Rod_6125]